MRTRFRRRAARQMIETGSASVIVVGLIAVAVVGAMWTAQLGAAAAQRARAQTAADAAALAGVVDGREAAEEISGANGASMTGWVSDGGPDGWESEVAVRSGDAVARARARRPPAPVPPPPDPNDTIPTTTTSTVPPVPPVITTTTVDPAGTGEDGTGSDPGSAAIARVQASALVRRATQMPAAARAPD